MKDPGVRTGCVNEYKFCWIGSLGLGVERRRKESKVGVGSISQEKSFY
jgi:hypothetical protein